MLGQTFGMKIIVSRFAYKTKEVTRGRADTRRPNRVKPLYRRVTIHIPLMYKIGNDIVCAPEWEAVIRQSFQKSCAVDWARAGEDRTIVTYLKLEKEESRKDLIDFRLEAQWKK